MLEPIREQIRNRFLQPESEAVATLLTLNHFDAQTRSKISADAILLIEKVRSFSNPGLMEAFLAEYGLSTKEGVALMCLAEALLRVPDAETIDELIQDKIVPHNWASHIGDSGSILVNASTWALMLTGRMLDDDAEGVSGLLQGLLRRLGEPVVRVAVERAMGEMGEQFVLGQDVSEATKNANARVQQGYTYSYDMLGEAARTEADAIRYHQAYFDAIEAIIARAHSDDLRNNPGISVKLSALHPLYRYRTRNEMMESLCERLRSLCIATAKGNIGLNIDAEEAERLDISLDVIEHVMGDKALSNWDGFGIVVQAYGQRATYVLDWLYQLAGQLDRKIMVRLVKGAYWDTEVKRSQVLGLSGYPVYTQKATTDLSYIVCAQKLMEMRDRIYPQFATHNAHTVAAILALSNGDTENFEFQRLHGMGESLHDIVKERYDTRCRIYAPVGTHQDLLAYLVRRLLENGANSSFVNQIVDESISPEEIAKDPVEQVKGFIHPANTEIPLPQDIYGPGRINSKGWDLEDAIVSEALISSTNEFSAPYQWGHVTGNVIRNPGNPGDIVGLVSDLQEKEIDQLMSAAAMAQQSWHSTSAEQRAKCLLLAADYFESHQGELFSLLIREAGKTYLDCIAELREAVDFLRYYATEVLNPPYQHVTSYTAARGIIVCISPWNFPLAIFTGQVAAALISGNAVVAKPAEQTPLIAMRAVQLLHAAGVPESALVYAPGDGETVGAALVSHPKTAGVCFTGSTEVAKIIHQQLARSQYFDPMLIAETGGRNAMIVDSTALLEQAVEGIIESAFQSAGQRCSALRILYVQEDIRERLLTMLFGAIDTLTVGDPGQPETDIGPIIDEQALTTIAQYCQEKSDNGQCLYQSTAPKKGNFFPPTVIAVSGITELTEEIFGPVLHVASFASNQVNSIVEEINGSGYGLTMGLHTRIDSRVQEVVNRAEVGNLYVNRNQIGAIVGSQPFGGEGLSGTGPKAGGPHYLRRFRINNADIGSDVSKKFLKPSMSTVSEKDIFDVLSKFSMNKVDTFQVLAKLRQGLRGKAAQALELASALDHGPIDLPGPTGESNQLVLHPLGSVLCLSNRPMDLLDRVAQALCAGNRVVAVGTGARKTLQSLLYCDLPLEALDGELDLKALMSLPFQGVSADDSVDLASVREILGARSGPIIRFVTERFYPAAYTTERTICIDTTAAGGNAELLASATAA